MSLTATTHAELTDRTRVAYARTRAVLEATDPELRPPGGGWSCHEVAAHLLTVLCRYTHRDFTEAAGLSAHVSELAAQNDAELAAVRGLSHGELLHRLNTEFADYAARTPLPLAQSFPFHGGASIDGAGAASNLIGELLLHGFDVARAARLPWPITERDAVLVLNGALQVASAWVNTATAPTALDVAIHVRGGTPQLFHFADGDLQISDRHQGDRRPDAVVHGPAGAVLLLFYGRITLPGAIRRGVIVTGGRRPWTGLRLSSFFHPA